MLKKGYANPSFAADSADRMRLRLIGTCLTANFPPWKQMWTQNVNPQSTLPAQEYLPTMAAQMIGSVGVRQAAMASEEMNDNLGNNACVITNGDAMSRGSFQKLSDFAPATTIQPNAIVGTTITSKPFACFAM
jgi:hypothetical protein